MHFFAKINPITENKVLDFVQKILTHVKNNFWVLEPQNVKGKVVQIRKTFRFPSI